MGYPNDEAPCLVDFSKKDQDWLEDIGALEEGVDCCGDGTSRKRIDVGALRKALEKAFPSDQTIDEYAESINLITGNVDVSGTAFIAACEDMTDLESASFALKVAELIASNAPACEALVDTLIDPDATNTIRKGPNKKLFENDAVAP